MIKTKQMCYICGRDGYHESIEECLNAAIARAEAAEEEAAGWKERIDESRVRAEMAEAKEGEARGLASQSFEATGVFCFRLYAAVDRELEGDEGSNFDEIVAAVAALRAAADEVVPAEMPEGPDCCLSMVEAIRRELLAIAAELEAQP